MTTTNKAYVEHVAIRVRDINWHIRYFKEVLGMAIREVQGQDSEPQQVWMIGGVQLIAAPDLRSTETCLAHLGIMVNDLQRAIRETVVRGCKEMPQGQNWFSLPDGLLVELIQAQPDSVAAALAVRSRA